MFNNMHVIISGMKNEPANNEFGKRLAYFRKAKGLTQRDLAKIIGVSNRVIAYYESETKYPPSKLLIPIADTLGITTDELLGRSSTNIAFDPQNTALWRNLKMVEDLPKTDQKAILHYIKMMVKSRRIEQKGIS